MSLSDVVKSMALVSVLELEEQDQFRLLDIRNQPLIRESSYTTHVIGADEHLRWLKNIKEDSNRHFYAVYRENSLMGGVGLHKNGPETGEWSFYISQDAHGMGMGLGLAVHALDLFFDKLGLEQVTGEALTANTASVNFHEKVGFRKTGAIVREILPSKQNVEVSCFSLQKSTWLEIRAGLFA